MATPAARKGHAQGHARLQFEVQLCHQQDAISLILGRSDLQAFCAGGDVKGAVLSARDGRPKDALEFFRTEYGALLQGRS